MNLKSMNNGNNGIVENAIGENDCTDEKNEARLSLFKSAGKEIAKTLCSGLYTTTDNNGKNLKQVMMDRISDVVFEVANTPDTIRTIRKAITVPLEKYSEQLFEVTTADADRINSFTANVLQNLFNKTDTLIPKLLEHALSKLSVDERSPDIVMSTMADRILELLSEGNKTSLGMKVANEGATVFGFDKENIQAKDKFEEDFSDEKPPVQELVTPEQAQSACNKNQSVNFVDVRTPPSETTEKALCEVNTIIQTTGDEINTRIVNAIDKEYIQQVVDKAVKVFLNKFKNEFRVRLIDNMVNAQGKIFISQPVMKIQILYSILTADPSRSKPMFIVGKKIFTKALSTYLATIATISNTPSVGELRQFLVELDNEFIAAIAIDSGSSIIELPTKIVDAIKKLESLPERASKGGRIIKKSRSNKTKSKKTKSKKTKSKKTRKSRK